MSTLTGHSTATNPEQRHRKEAGIPLFIDASALARELRGAISGEVRFDDGSRALYATDGSNYRQVPIGVVVPRSQDDVIATVDVCRRYGAPLLSRGGGTSLTGGCCNIAVVMDWSKYLNRVLWVDPDRKLARVQPGCVLDKLRGEAEKHNLTFAPDPSTHNHCTLGGMIGNNSCGVHSLIGLGTGRTSDQVDELDVVLYDGTRMTVGPTGDEELERIIQAGGRRGEIYAKLKALRDRYADLIRAATPRSPAGSRGITSTTCCPSAASTSRGRSSGTEGTCVTVLEAQLHLVPSPPMRLAAGPGISGRLRSRRPRRGDPRSRANRPGGTRRHPGQGHEDQGDPSPRRQPPAARRRLAPGRVRRRIQGRGRRQGPGPDVPAQGALRTPPP